MEERAPTLSLTGTEDQGCGTGVVFCPDINVDLLNWIKTIINLLQDVWDGLDYKLKYNCLTGIDSSHHNHQFWAVQLWDVFCGGDRERERHANYWLLSDLFIFLLSGWCHQTLSVRASEVVSPQPQPLLLFQDLVNKGRLAILVLITLIVETN